MSFVNQIGGMRNDNELEWWGVQLQNDNSIVTASTVAEHSARLESWNKGFHSSKRLSESNKTGTRETDLKLHNSLSSLTFCPFSLSSACHTCSFTLSPARWNGDANNKRDFISEIGHFECCSSSPRSLNDESWKLWQFTHFLRNCPCDEIWRRMWQRHIYRQEDSSHIAGCTIPDSHEIVSWCARPWCANLKIRFRHLLSSLCNWAETEIIHYWF